MFWKVILITFSSIFIVIIFFYFFVGKESLSFLNIFNEEVKIEERKDLDISEEKIKEIESNLDIVKENISYMISLYKERFYGECRDKKGIINKNSGLIQLYYVASESNKITYADYPNEPKILCALDFEGSEVLIKSKRTTAQVITDYSERGLGAIVKRISFYKELKDFPQINKDVYIYWLEKAQKLAKEKGLF